MMATALAASMKLSLFLKGFEVTVVTGSINEPTKLRDLTKTVFCKCYQFAIVL